MLLLEDFSRCKTTDFGRDGSQNLNYHHTKPADQKQRGCGVSNLSHSEETLGYLGVNTLKTSEISGLRKSEGGQSGTLEITH